MPHGYKSLNASNHWELVKKAGIRSLSEFDLVMGMYFGEQWFFFFNLPARSFF